MKKKKVLHIFGIMNRGGAELRTLSTVPEMTSRKVTYDYLVLSGQKGVLDDSIKASGSVIHYCKLGPMFLSNYVKILRHNDYDVVHSHVSLVSGLMLLIAWMCGIKVRIAHFRSTHDVETPSIFRRLRDHMLRFLLRRFATSIVGVSKATLDAFWHREWPHNTKFKVIYNGFPRVKFSQTPDFWQSVCAKPSHGPWILHVARMHEQKNQIFLMRVFCEYLKQASHATLVMVGKEDPVIKRELLHTIAEFGAEENVIFTGEQAEVLPFMLHADLMLFPSKWEGLPGAVMESARVGLRVLGSKIPPIEEVSEKLPCVQALPLEKTPKEWADKITRVLAEKTPTNTYRQAFIESEFQLENNVKQLFTLYTQ